MSGIAPDTTQQPIVVSAPQIQQPAAIHAEHAVVPDISQPIHNTNTNGYISQEPPAYHETAEKNQIPSTHPADPAAYNHPSQGNPGQGRMVTPLERLGEEPALVDCPFCKRVTTTRVGSEHSTMTVLAGFLLGCICICLACIPCIAHSCADIDQYCSECNKKLTHRPYDKPVQVVAVRDSELQVSKYPASQQVPSEQPGQVYK